MAKARGGSAKQTQPARMQSARQALREKTNTSRSKLAEHEDNGNQEPGKKTTRTGQAQRNKRVPEPEDGAVMSGALGLREEVGRDSDVAMPQSRAHAAKNHSAEHSERILPAPTTNRRPRGARKIVPTEAQQNILAGMKRRMEDTAKAHRSMQAADAVSLEDTIHVRSMVPTKPGSPAIAAAGRSSSPPLLHHSQNSLLPGNGRSSIMPPGSAFKIHGTPAMENSLLALRNFKRRPRQLSMLQMVQQRTTSARPSAVHPAPATGEADDRSSELDLGLDDLEDEDDFAPDAEGTPLKANSTQLNTFNQSRKSAVPQLAPVEVSSTGATRKRKSTELAISPASSQSRGLKRNRSSSVIIRDGFVAASEDSFGSQASSSIELAASRSGHPVDVEVVHSSLPSSPPPDARSRTLQADLSDSEVLVASSWQAHGNAKTSQAANTRENNQISLNDGTMVEPLSSSPLPEPRRAPVYDDDELADPATQQSPTPARRKTRNAKERSLSTAQLRTLLPRRRRQVEARPRKTVYDLQSESNEEVILAVENPSADDGVALPSARGPPRKRASAVVKKSRPSRDTAQTRKSGIVARKKAVVAPTRKGISRTYGRKSMSDKENDSANDSPFEEANESTLPDLSLTMHEAAKSQELEAARRKFAEIDDWNMEFESLGGEDHRSSSIGWR